MGGDGGGGGESHAQAGEVFFQHRKDACLTVVVGLIFVNVMSDDTRCLKRLSGAVLS